jgi:hypothetical protein
MVSTIDESMPEARFFIFFDSIMPPTASAATVTTRFSIVASFTKSFNCDTENPARRCRHHAERSGHL